ncbi:MAG: carbamoyltransferase [Bacteroidetes bacterium]|nr:carbamoyltransferase [Bacteroidota bacterium]MDE2671559.1 carbamoyltransferase [Bacteroidota bacterium]
MTYILGISCWYHDSAACLLKDGIIIAAAQEERFTRVKHDASLPVNAIAWCLSHAGITAEDLSIVSYYDKPFLKFERLLETYLSGVPQGIPSFIKAMPVWLKRSLWIPDILRKEIGFRGTLLFCEHHESHAASAFFPSPFDRAAIITTDGVGEWATTSLGIGNRSGIVLKEEIHFPHSLGLLYSTFTGYCGFRVNSGEYKLMGLAPYGEPRFVQTILDELVDLKEDGSYRLNIRYFSFPWGLRMYSRAFEDLFGGRARSPESSITRRELDLARSIQVVTEEVVQRMARRAATESGERKLCMAGGVALNCVANGKLLRSGLFEEIWIQPAAGDAGGALGAALMAWHDYAQVPREACVPDAMEGAKLGPSYDADDIRAALETASMPYEELSEEPLCRRTAESLAAQKVIGWFQGRMEYGPRALGNRSILADPRQLRMQRHVNQSIKFRENFRPFAPAVLVEKVSDWFDMNNESPYMLLTAQVRDAHIRGEGLERQRNIESPIAAVTHVDGSARVQTVSEQGNSLFYRLLQKFEALTGCPVLVNTSFNVRGEPIVCAPEDAIRCFQDTHMDILVIGPFWVSKKDVV